MRTQVSALLLVLLLVPAWAGEDEWAVQRPTSKPRGKKYVLRVALDPETAHQALVHYEQEVKLGGESGALQIQLKALVRALGVEADDKTDVGAEFDIRSLTAGEEDMTEMVRAAAAGAHVKGTVSNGRVVAGCESLNTDSLGPLAEAFFTLPAWLLPHLPEEPVQKGEVWDLPVAYFLWEVRQMMDGEPKGESFQVFEALETRNGVECARLKTLVSVRTELPNGSTLLGEGAAVSHVKAEATHWFGLDGYLREATTRVRLRVTKTATDQTLEWRMQRDVTDAGPVPAPAHPLGKDWTPFMGKLPFVVGYEEGMKEARFTGKAPMFFFTSIGSGAGRALASTAFEDDKVCTLLAGYTPILIDAETEESFKEGRELLFQDPTILWEDLDGNTVFTISGGLPSIPGIDNSEMAVTMFEIPGNRVPDPRPSEAYQSLVSVRDRLRSARGDDDRGAAVAAILEIQAVGQGVTIQREAREADRELRAYADEQLATAVGLLKEKRTREKGRAILETLVEEFEGHGVAERARGLLDAKKSR